MAGILNNGVGNTFAQNPVANAFNSGVYGLRNMGNQFLNTTENAARPYIGRGANMIKPLAYTGAPIAGGMAAASLAPGYLPIMAGSALGSTLFGPSDNPYVDAGTSAVMAGLGKYLGSGINNYLNPEQAYINSNVSVQELAKYLNPWTDYFSNQIRQMQPPPQITNPISPDVLRSMYA